MKDLMNEFDIEMTFHKLRRDTVEIEGNILKYLI